MSIYLGVRTAKYTISDIDAKIMDYEKKLVDLKKAFLEGVTVHTGITVIRMMNVVERIGRSDLTILDQMFTDQEYSRSHRLGRNTVCFRR